MFLLVRLKDGIPGCGVKTAVQIARTGIGRNLIHAVRHLPNSNLSVYCRQWAKGFKAQLEHNMDKTLPRRYPQLAKAIPVTFLDITSTKLYVQPLTSEANGGALPIHHANPDLAKLAFFAEENFVWGHFLVFFAILPKMYFQVLLCMSLLVSRCSKIIDSTRSRQNSCSQIPLHTSFRNVAVPVLAIWQNYALPFQFPSLHPISSRIVFVASNKVFILQLKESNGWKRKHREFELGFLLL